MSPLPFSTQVEMELCGGAAFFNLNISIAKSFDPAISIFDFETRIRPLLNKGMFHENIHLAL
jgi:hypothetical protein